MKTEKIVVATDFSGASMTAVETAFGLASESRSTVYLVFVQEIPLIMDPVLGAAADSGQRTHAEEQLRGLIPDNLLAKTETVILDGTPAHEIAAFAARVDADLIIVGTHARKGLSRMLLGSTAEKLLREAPCQVLVAKQRTRAAEPVSKPPVKPLLDSASRTSSERAYKGDPIC